MKRSGRRNADIPLYKRYIMAEAVGSGVGMAVLLIMMCLFAFVMSAGGLPGSTAMIFSVISLVAASVTSGFLTARVLRERGLLAGAASGILLIMFCYAVGAVAGMAGDGSALLFRLIIAVSSAAVGGVAGVNLHRRVV